MIKVKEFTYDEMEHFSANSYIIYDDLKNAFIVDPGCKDDRRDAFIEENSLNVIGILLTHAHFDHIRGLTDAKSKYKVKIIVADEDKILLNNANINLSSYFGDYFVFNYNEEEDLQIIKDDKTIIEGLNEQIIAIKTPFHTPGSVCYYLPDSKILLSGDTLFNGSVGRTDFPLGDSSLVKSSLNKLRELPGDTVVYPGHNGNTSLEEEFKFNQFFQL